MYVCVISVISLNINFDLFYKNNSLRFDSDTGLSACLIFHDFLKKIVVKNVCSKCKSSRITKLSEKKPKHK